MIENSTRKSAQSSVEGSAPAHLLPLSLLYGTVSNPKLLITHMRMARKRRNYPPRSRVEAALVACRGKTVEEVLVETHPPVLRQ